MELNLKKNLQNLCFFVFCLHEDVEFYDKKKQNFTLNFIMILLLIDGKFIIFERWSEWGMVFVGFEKDGIEMGCLMKKYERIDGKRFIILKSLEWKEESNLLGAWKKHSFLWGNM